MQCPDCDKELYRATVCGCGWRMKTQAAVDSERPRALCAHDGCNVSSLCRIKTATGSANLCERHYLAHFQRRADDYCESMGITTLVQKRKFVKEKVAGIYRMREPGEEAA